MNADAAKAIAEFQHRNESLHRHHDLDKPSCAYCDMAGRNALAALEAAGFTVARLEQHGWSCLDPSFVLDDPGCDDCVPVFRIIPEETP